MLFDGLANTLAMLLEYSAIAAFHQQAGFGFSPGITQQHTAAFGLNDKRQVVGDYTRLLSTPDIQGFVWTWPDSPFVTIAFPGAQKITRL